MWKDMEKYAEIFQKQIAEVKKQLEDSRFTGESDDNKVLVVANGLEEIISISIYCDKLPYETRKNLEQAIVKAVNNALVKVRKALKQKTEDIAEGFNFPY
ncbi:MAG: YbaB/EbfC family nucleoid-associated protein [Tepidanaerobacteraceae bacterium]